MLARRIIVCGGRGYEDVDRIREVLAPHMPTTTGEDVTVVHGDARGVDRLVERVAAFEGADVECYPANWKRYGKAAGPIRNQKMVLLGADLCIAFPGGVGTYDMVQRAVARGIPVEWVDVWKWRVGVLELAPTIDGSRRYAPSKPPE